MTVWVRQHRLLAIALACAVLAVAGIVPFALANSPRSPSSPGTPNSPSNSADAGSGANGSVTVRGAFGTTPSVSIPKLDADNKLFVKTVISGTGTTVTKSDSVVVNYVLYLWNGTSSSLKANTFTSSPTIIGGTLLPGLQTALTGQKVGGRVLAVIPPADGYGSSGESQLGVSGTTTLVFVVDVIAAYPANASASGTPVSDGGSSLPTVSAEPGSAPVVTIPSSSPPSTLQVRTLIKGAGPTVAKGEYVIAQYVGYNWRTEKVFGSSWSTGTPFGFTFDAQPEQVISGWDIGLAGQTVGSRVLLVIPPNDGYGSAGDSQAGITGTDTLVDVVDILGAFKSAS